MEEPLNRSLPIGASIEKLLYRILCMEGSLQELPHRSLDIGVSIYG